MDPRLIDHDKLRAELRAQERKRWQHPDRAPDLVGVSLVYAWLDDRWHLVNFVRTPKTITPKVLRRIRRRSGVTRHFPIMLRELWLVERDGHPTLPPQHIPTTRPDAVPDALPLPLVTPKQPARRITRNTALTFTRATRWIAVGTLHGARQPVLPLYLGPCAAHEKRSALAEAKRRWGALYTIRVVAVAELPKKSWRKRLLRGTIIPGITRLQLTALEVLA